MTYQNVSPAKVFSAIKENAVLLELKHNPIFLVSGEDADRYLQGRITQDISLVNKEMSKRSLILSPQGKIQGHFLIVRAEEEGGFFFVSDPLDEKTDTQELISELLKFVVADRVQLKDVSDEYSFFSLQGSKAQSILGSLGDVSPFKKRFFTEKQGGIYIIQNPRFLELGFDILLKTDSYSVLSPEISSLDICSQSTEELLRIFFGTPRFISEMKAKALAPELVLDDELVSFSKGCYAGQEVVEMAIARGRPSKRLCHFEVASSKEVFSPGSKIHLKDSSKGIGEITSSAVFPEMNLSRALGFLKTSVDENAELFVKDTEVKLLGLI